MGAYEKRREYYVYEDGSVTHKPPEGIPYIFTYHTREADGARFVRKGAERTLVVDISPSATPDQVRKAAEKSDLSDRIKNAILDELDKGSLASRSIDIELEQT